MARCLSGSSPSNLNSGSNPSNTKLALGHNQPRLRTRSNQLAFGIRTRASWVSVPHSSFLLIAGK
eukprot:m.288214 g.288214  ORF g.288214 m.288214 type:complete len:65 (+) comp55035_c1_seq2:456-650(+)